MPTLDERVQAAKEWTKVALECKHQGKTLEPRFAVMMSMANSLIVIAEVLVNETKGGGSLRK